VTQGGSAIATYSYDALNRRIGFKVNGTQSWTVYDGNGSMDNPYADFDGSGNLRVRYLYGLVVDQVLSRTDSSGNMAWYVPDRLGTIRDIANTSGSVIDHVVYSGFGNIASESNAPNGDRFKFAGREYNTETSHYYYRGRNFSPIMGRFQSVDPMGFPAGDANLYRYVGNRPTNSIDPSGLLSKEAQQLLDEYEQAVKDGLSDGAIIATLIMEALILADGKNAGAFGLIYEIRSETNGANDNDVWASADHFFNVWEVQARLNEKLGQSAMTRFLGAIGGFGANLFYSDCKILGIEITGRDNTAVPPTPYTYQQYMWGKWGADASLFYNTNMRPGGPDWRSFVGWMEKLADKMADGG
jgi:RHS repeat-associated protein